MSLIGSLEDLNLGDILQIISLSRKSGVLILSGEAGEGRIVFRDGLVCSAALKGGPEDLRGLLVDGGFVEGDDFQLVRDEARERGVEVDEMIVEHGMLERERLEAICREAVEVAVVAMFQWREGDFSFDVMGEAEGNEPGFVLTVGINAQYLAMESMRQGDESARDGNEDDEVAGEELSAHEMFGVSPGPDSDADPASGVDSGSASTDCDRIEVDTLPPEWGDEDEEAMAEVARPGWETEFQPEEVSDSVLPEAEPIAAAELVASDVADQADQADQAAQAAQIVAMAAVEAIDGDATMEVSSEILLETPVFAAEPIVDPEPVSDFAEEPLEVVSLEPSSDDSLGSGEPEVEESLVELTEDALQSPPIPPIRDAETPTDPARAESFEAAMPAQIDGEPSEARADSLIDALPLGASDARSALDADAVIEGSASLEAAPPEKGSAVDGEASDALDGARELLDDPVVVIDPDLSTLEWVKRVLKSRFAKVHIFQRSELGLARIRQYLVRMEAPIVLISVNTEGDRLCGISNAHDFVRRLRLQSSRMSIFWLSDRAQKQQQSLGAADGILVRPSEAGASDSGEACEEGDEDELGKEILRQLGAETSKAGTAPGMREAEGAAVAEAAEGECATESDSPAASSRLEEVTEVLSAGASRGEVLPLVMQFASECFSRVAMFMVRDDRVVGMAQRGLSALGGPDDQALQKISIGREDCAWFRRVFESRGPVTSGPDDEGDRMLASYLGEREPSQAYVAPISSSGQIVALLYADNLPQETVASDTSALEVVLQHAGLALERAVLERSLAEIEAGS